MSWLPKRERLNPKQASEYPPAVRPLAKQVARYNGNNSFSSRTRLAEGDCSLTTERLG